MTGRVLVDGEWHRWRRGRLVPIPAAWVGQTLHPQTKRKRPSKALHKYRKEIKHGGPRRPEGPSVEEYET